MEIPHNFTPRQLAERAANLLLQGRREQNGGRDFDNCWEMENPKAVARAFMRLYWNDGSLREASQRYMGTDWTGYMEGLYPLSRQEQSVLSVEANHGELETNPARRV